jgi:L-cysteate sulfo-lyase
MREYPAGTDFDAAMDAVADEVRSRGGSPYIIPGGASNRVGALGHVQCAIEMLQQFEQQQLDVSAIVTATGSAGTQAGLAVGLKAMNSDIALLGIGVSAPREVQEQKVFDLACETAEFIGKPGIVRRTDAVTMLASLEGLLFDPVYSGKALAGMIDLLRKGRFETGETIVFLHTGGSPALYAYADQLNL